MPDIEGSPTDDTSKSLFLVGLAIFVVFGLTFTAGLGEARRSDNFPVDKEGRVLLRRYGNTAVFGYYDPTENNLRPSISRAELSTVTAQFELKRIGPLLATEPAKIDKPALLPANASVTPTAKKAGEKP